MDTDRELTRIVRSWLQTDEIEHADRVLDHVLALLDTTPQHRSWWPARRYSPVNVYVKLAVMAAAVVVVAAIGLSLLPVGSSVGGGPAATPSPRASPSPTPAGVFPPSGELAVGRRHPLTLVGVPLTFTVPASGWISNGEWGLDKTVGTGADSAGFILWPSDSPIGVYADPCKAKPAPRVGPSTTDMAAAIAKIPGTDLVSGPTDVTVGGHPAKHVVIKIREDIGCAPNDFQLWYAAPEGLSRYATRLGDTIGVWVIDADGTRVQIDGETSKNASPELGQQVQQIVDSIKFD